jgi:hypothetical protein
MNALEITAFLLTSVGIVFLYPRARSKRALLCCWLAVQPYCAILLINASFPYTYKYDRIEWIAPLVLGMVSILAGSIYFAFNKLVRSDLKGAPDNRLLQPQPILYLLSYAAVGALFAEFAINPEFRFNMDLAENREVLSKAGIIGTVGRVFAGSALLLLQLAVGNVVKTRSAKTSAGGKLTSGLLASSLIQILPFSLCALFFLASGNRQFLFIGMLITTFTLIYNSGLRYFINAKTVAGAAVLLLLGIWFQFLRNRGSEGRQDEFLRNAIGIVENENNVLGSNYYVNSAAMLLFTYYGLEYNTLSAVLASDLHASVPFVNTLPVVYRRIDAIFGFEDQLQIAARSQEILENELNGFGGVWVTMFGTFYSEFAWSSFFGYPLMAVIIVFILSKSPSAARSVEIRFCAMLTCLAFGVHYVITKEVPGFGYVACVGAPWGIMYRTSQKKLLR